MKRVIHHYKVEAFPGLSVQKVPFGSAIISAAIRNGRPALYVEKPTQPRNDRQAEISTFFVGTGHDFDCPENYRFIATLSDGPFMWHVFARII
jgi:hypothetical protein